ncbi:rieske iron-sulfur protein TIC55, partial [Trifolium medium]|nr:rieske iron-sulfur protein TIC55 [Trifolium medium]
MALINPFLLPTKTHLALHVLPTKTHLALHVLPLPSKKSLLWTNPSSSFNFNKGLSSSRRKQAGCVAAAADIKAA